MNQLNVPQPNHEKMVTRLLDGGKLVPEHENATLENFESRESREFRAERMATKFVL